MKNPRRVSPNWWERMEAYLNSNTHLLETSGRKIADLLLKQFPDYPGNKARLRETAEVRGFVLKLQAIRNADKVYVADKLEQLDVQERGGISADFTKDAGTIEGKRVKSLDDLISTCEIDLNVWEVERYVSNKWEVGAKDINSEIQVTPLYQIKAWLRRKAVPDFDYQQVRDGVIAEMQQHAPAYRSFKRLPITDGHLQVLDPADTHFGKLAHFYSTGDTYTLKDAARKVTEGFEGLVNKSQGFNTDRFYLILGNDMLHVDNAGRTTTKGTKQDTDGMWYEAFMTAKRTFVEVIEGLATIADVDVVFNPSNHDYTSGWMLFDSISSWFHNAKNITFDGTMRHRKYYQYHDSLIGTTHGNGVKPGSLMAYMPVEAKAMWGSTTHRNWYYHHVHHYNKAIQPIGKDYVGGTVQSVRSLSGTDVYHDEQGYTGVPKAIESFVHSKKHGQIAQFTHIFS